MNKQEVFPQITVAPQVRFGKPLLAGTRVPVDLVVGKIAGGMTQEEVMQEYELQQTQILTALQYAAQIVALEELAFA